MKHGLSRRIAILLVLIMVIGLGLVSQTARASSVIVVPDLAENLTTNKGYQTIEEALNDAESGETVQLNNTVQLETSTTLKAGVTLTFYPSTSLTIKPGVTLSGEEGSCVEVDGTGHRIVLAAGTAAGTGGTIRNLNIVKTDSDNQDIVAVNSGATVEGCTFTGQYELGGNQTTRAMEVTAGAQNILIKGNTISALRQPAYVNGCSGSIMNNKVTGTRGWVICSEASLTITGNTFATGTETPNAVDIAIIKSNEASTNPNDNFSGIASLNGGVGYVEHQIKKASTKDGVYIVAPTANSYATLDGALNDAQDGSTILFLAGTHGGLTSNKLSGSNLTITGEEGAVLSQLWLQIEHDIKKLTVQDLSFAKGSGLMIYHPDSTYTDLAEYIIRDNVFTATTNYAIGFNGRNGGSSNPLFSNLTIEGNSIDGGLGILVQNAKDATSLLIKNNTIKNVKENGILINGVTGNSVTIEGNLIQNWNTENGSNPAMKAYHLSTPQLTINGNKFIPGTTTTPCVFIGGAAGYSMFPAASNLNGNYWGSAAPDFSTLVKDGSTVSVLNTYYEDEGLTQLKHLPFSVTKNGKTSSYATLASAAAAAAANDTLFFAAPIHTETLAANVTLPTQLLIPAGTNLTLDLNGHTLKAEYSLTASAISTLRVMGGKLTLNDSGTDGTVTMNGKGGLGDSTAVVVRGAGEFVMNGGKLTATGAGAPTGIDQQSEGPSSSTPSRVTINGGCVEAPYYPVFVAGNGIGTPGSAILTVNGGTITATQDGFAISGNGKNQGGVSLNGGTVIDIKGGTIKASNGVGIYHPQTGVLNISGGTITDCMTGVEIRSGTLNMTGGEIITTVAGSKIPDVSNGAIYSGDGIAAVSNSGYLGNITLNITGGTVKSAGNTAVCEYITKGNSSNITSATIRGAALTSNAQNPLVQVSALADRNTTVDPDIAGFALTREVEINNAGTTTTTTVPSIAHYDAFGKAFTQATTAPTASGDIIRVAKDVDVTGLYTITGNTLSIKGVPNANGVKPAFTGDGSVGLFKIDGTSQVSMENLTLTKGKADNGGAVFVGTSARLIARDCDFIENQATASYGAAVAANGDFIASGCTFKKNSYTGNSNGGAVGVSDSDSSAHTELVDCAFEDNASTGYGGALLLNNLASANVSNCAFINNTSTSGAGAIYGLATPATVTGSTFTNNKGKHGDAIYTAADSPIALTNCTFTGNTATGGNGGGGTYHSGPATISGCLYQNNIAAIGDGGKGGGAIVFGSGSAGSTVTTSAFIGNSATGTGKGQHVYAGAAVNLSGNYWNGGAKPSKDGTATNVDVYVGAGGNATITNYYTTYDALTGALGGLTAYTGSDLFYYYIGTDGYRTIEAAMAEVGQNDVIKLLKDVEKDLIITKNVTLDGNGSFGIRGAEITPDKILTLHNATASGSITGAGSLVATGTVHVKGSVTATVNATGTLYVDGAATHTTVDGNVYHPVSATAANEAMGTAGHNATTTAYGGKTYAKRGAQVAFTALPNAGYGFKAWSNGETSTPHTVALLDKGTHLTAEFEALVTAINGLDDRALYIGDSFLPTWTLTPANPANPALTWASQKPAVASVDQSTGAVTARAIGWTNITATAHGGTTANYAVKVMPRVTFNPRAYTLVHGTTANIGTVISPADAAGYALSVGNTGVATISGGVLTATSPGTTTIYAKSSDDVLAEATVTVVERIPVTSITANLPATTLAPGAKLDIAKYLTVLPAGYNDTLHYASSVTDVATVDATGMVTAVANGSTTITVTAKNGNAEGVTRTISLTVGEVTTLPDNVYFKNELNTYNVDDSAVTLNTLLSGLDSTKYEEAITYSASANDIVSIADGEMSFLKSGAVKLTANVTLTLKGTTTSKNYTATTMIVVDRVAPNTVTVSIFEASSEGCLLVGDTLGLNATATPSTAKQDVTWTSSNTTVATVDVTGKVTALTAGETTITATSKYADVSDTYALTVHARPTSLSFHGGEVVTVAKDDSKVYKANFSPAGSTWPITYTVTPANSQFIEIVTGNTGNDGFKATGPGTAIVTATTTPTANGFSLSASQTVTVVEKVTGVTWDAYTETTGTEAPITPSNGTSALALEVNDAGTLSWTTTPADVSTTLVSSDPSTVTVANNGELTALKAGTATITATARTADGTTASATLTVTVTATLKRIFIPDAITVATNTDFTIEPVIDPVGATATVKWYHVDGATETEITNSSTTPITLTNGKFKVANDATNPINVKAKVGAVESEVCAITAKATVTAPTSMEMTEPVTKATRKAAFSKSITTPTASFTLVMSDTPTTFPVSITFDGNAPAGFWNNVSVTSANPAIATAAKGTNAIAITITPTAAGTTDIRVHYKEGNVTALYRINVVNPIAGIDLSGTANALTLGETTDLVYAFDPSGHTDVDATMTNLTVTDPSGCVSYDPATGKLTAIKAGIPTITVAGTVTSRGNAAGVPVTANRPITVTAAPVQSITLPYTTLALVRGTSATLSATITPSNTGKTVTASGSKDNVSIRTENGATTITAEETGEGFVIFTAGEKTAYLQVDILPPQITKALSIGDTYAWGKVIGAAYASSKEGVARVDDGGNITAVGAGTATITARRLGVESRCEVTVARDIKPVTNVALSQSSLYLYTGGTATLTAAVTPADATNKTVFWTSSNTAVATVNGGLVTAVGVGNATITAETADGGFRANCTVTVTAQPGPGPSDEAVLRITPSAASIKEGETTVLKASATLPQGATIGDIAWSVGDEAIATITPATGAQVTVTAHKAGKTTVRASATTSGGKLITADCAITVTAEGEPPIDDPVTLETIFDVLVIEAKRTTALPIFRGAKVTWSVSDPEIAVITKNGKNIKAVKPGTATLTLAVDEVAKAKAITIDGHKLKEGAVYEIELRVRKKGVLPTSVKVNKKSVTLDTIADTSFQVVANAAPKAKIKDHEIFYASKDPSIATVDKDGMVRAVAPGKTTIFAYSANLKLARIDVTVRGLVTQITLRGEQGKRRKSVTLQKGEQFRLFATVNEDALNKELTWESGKPKYASVDETGLITALKKGTATITVRAADGSGTKATVKVTIK